MEKGFLFITYSCIIVKIIIFLHIFFNLEKKIVLHNFARMYRQKIRNLIFDRVLINSLMNKFIDWMPDFIDWLIYSLLIKTKFFFNIQQFYWNYFQQIVYSTLLFIHFLMIYLMLISKECFKKGVPNNSFSHFFIHWFTNSMNDWMYKKFNCF